MASFEIFVKVVERCRSRLGLFLATFLHSLPTFAITGQRGNHGVDGHRARARKLRLSDRLQQPVAQAIQTNNVIPKIVENLHAAISERADSQAIVRPEVAPAQAQNIK
jgi:hypothetical protein